MTVSVLIPFTSDDPWRVRARNHVADSYGSRRWEVVVGASPDAWRKAVAVADAAGRSTGEILVVADADCLCKGVVEAVDAVEAGAAWAMPHGRVHRLDQAATAAVYDGSSTLPAATTTRTEGPYQGWPGGGIVVVPRATWERIPMDPRFVGWSGEDESWAVALTTLAGPCERLHADLYHLWHPPADRISRRWGSNANRALAGRYQAASGDKAKMGALVAEAASAAS